MADISDSSSSLDDDQRGRDEPADFGDADIPDDEYHPSSEEDDQFDAAGGATFQEGAIPASSGLINARAYQLEMFEESMKQNIILAMDTGSGKTQVAVMRIKSELERSEKVSSKSSSFTNNQLTAQKRVWFLANTVALCTQQFQVLQSQIPAVQSKILRGEDNIDTWSDQATWDAILINTRIVVSTPQILLDALSHGFVVIESLSLIVFDEAHRSIRNDPGSRIMKDCYHPRKRQGLDVPFVMGLTASPTMRSNLNGLEALEETLDAVCRSPTVHRSDLLTYVNKPQLIPAFYRRNATNIPRSVSSLQQAFRGLDIMQDPYILHLQAQGTDRSQRDVLKALSKNNTYIQRQMTKFCQRSLQLLQDLGPWAAEYYVWKVVTDFTEAVISTDIWLDSWADKEKSYLSDVLGHVDIQKPHEESLGSETVTNKFVVLLEQLLTKDSADVVGIVFVKERSTAFVLGQLIASHPVTRQKYGNVGVMVGTSQHASNKREIWDLSRGGDLESLQRFRSGEINLLVATSVLEEGIDVPACNLVVCFDRPENLKSFIQRRGRARQQKSSLVILLDSADRMPKEWEKLEAEMKEQYENQARELRLLQAIEESEHPGLDRYVVGRAYLDHQNAKQRLDHFCAALSPGPYIESRADYITKPVDSDDPPSLHTTVLLPNYIPQAVRRAQSRKLWKSEKNSTKDAAFQAYVALHKAGLVNDNLLPLKATDVVPGIHRRAGVVDVNSPCNIWISVARAWKSGESLWSSQVTLKDPQGHVKGSYDMITPFLPPELPTAVIHPDRNEPWQVDFGPPGLLHELPSRDHTAVLLALNFKHRWPVEDRQHVVRFVARDGDISPEQQGARSLEAHEAHQEELAYLIRDKSGCPYIYDHYLPDKPPVELVQRPFRGFNDIPGFLDAPSDVPYLALKKWSRRTDFLHRPLSDRSKEIVSTKRYARVYPATWATVDAVPMTRAFFGALIPSILHHIEVRLVASELSSGLLGKLAIADLSLVLTAISAKSAGEPADYERLEFLGDSILKVCASVNVAALYTDWPEGYLSLLKDRLVSNSRLYKAAVYHGLDRFILSKPFTGHKWRPLYVEDLLDPIPKASEARRLSTKTLADVVEALIGASYVDDGLDKALSCISTFVGDIEWGTLNERQQSLYDIAPPDVELPPTLQPLEELIGYNFRKKSLLIQAATHASYSVDTYSGCLERLEFVGDAILDTIIVTRLFPLTHLSQSDMHLLKAACVNGDFLGFLAMECQLEEDQVEISNAASRSTDPSTDEPGQDAPDKSITPIRLERRKYALPLWKFLRHSSSSIAAEQKAAEERHARMRGPILEALLRGSSYPWALLAQLQVKKFYSDVLEAVFGAVWVDSGSLDVCAAVLERFGILSVMDRLIRDKVHLLHPKEELGRLADRNLVEYIVEMNEAVRGLDGESSDGAGGNGNEGGKRELSCKVIIGGRCMVEMGQGASREEIETRAAEQGVRILKEAKAREE